MDNDETKEERGTEQDLKEKYIGEYQRTQAVQQRWDTLQDRYPGLLSRLAILQTLVSLQDERGGEFVPNTVFVHMADYALNVRRIGNINLDTLTVAIQVYEHNDIVAGIVFVPIDQVWWAGTTDQPFGTERMGLLHHSVSTPPTAAKYEARRRSLAGLPPLPNTTASEKQ